MRPSPVLGYMTAPIGGVIPYAGNMVSNDLSTSRTGWMPLFTDKGVCPLRALRDGLPGLLPGLDTRTS